MLPHMLFDCQDHLILVVCNTNYIECFINRQQIYLSKFGIFFWYTHFLGGGILSKWGLEKLNQTAASVCCPWDLQKGCQVNVVGTVEIITFLFSFYWKIKYILLMIHFSLVALQKLQWKQKRSKVRTLDDNFNGLIYLHWSHRSADLFSLTLIEI